MTKYHITDTGEVKPCKATQGNCPFGGEGEHFSSEVEAFDFIEEQYWEHDRLEKINKIFYENSPNSLSVLLDNEKILTKENLDNYANSDYWLNEQEVEASINDIEQQIEDKMNHLLELRRKDEQARRNQTYEQEYVDVLERFNLYAKHDMQIAHLFRHCFSRQELVTPKMLLQDLDSRPDLQAKIGKNGVDQIKNKIWLWRRSAMEETGRSDSQGLQNVLSMGKERTTV